MKTYKDYLIDFETLEVGDKVYSLSNGYGKVVHISGSCTNAYPICVSFNKGGYTYTKKGKRILVDINPEIYREKPDFFKEKKEVKRWRWYYQPQEKSCGYISNNLETETEFLSIFHGENIEPPFKYEKIDCTEITEVVYE